MAKRKNAAAPTRKGGTGRYKFDEAELKRLEQLAALQCTQGEMAAVLGISRATLNRRIGDTPEVATAIEKGCDSGKASLRRLQWKAAEAGNPTMMIWLGKQYLDQRDKAELEATITSQVVKVPKRDSPEEWQEEFGQAVKGEVQKDVN